MLRVPNRPVIAPAALAALLAAVSPAAAFGQSLSEKAIESEISFARGLARRWAMVDLAQNVLDDVAETGPSERMAEEIALVRCELFAEGAKRASDPAEVSALIAQGIDAYEEYLDGNEDASNRTEAEKGLVSLSLAYSRSIDNQLEETAGEEADALRDKKLDVLNTAVERTDSLIDDIQSLDAEDRTPEQELAALNLRLQKGEMWTQKFKILEDPVSKSEAINVYQELMFDAGLDSEFALRANVGIGDVEALDGNFETAFRYYSGMVDMVLPADPDRREQMLGWSDLGRDVKELRFVYVELGMPGIQRSARAIGEYPQAIDSGLFLYNLYRQEGFTLSQFGHEALLEIAETLVNAGGYIGGDLGAGEAKWYATEEEMNAEHSRRERNTAVEFALELVNQVAEDTGLPSLKIKAGKLLNEINSRPDIQITAAQLQEAARARYFAKEYDAALEGYYALLERLDQMDQAEQIPFGASTFLGIGDTLQKQGRYLEAAMAFREGVTAWYDEELNSRNAKRFRGALREWGTQAGVAGTNEYESLMTEAEDLVLEHAEEGSQDSILYSQGNKLFSADKFDEAIAKWGEIPEGTDYYEPAQVSIGLALQKSGDVGGALAKFDDFIETYAPANPPENDADQAVRDQALAQAIYYAGFLEHAIARAVLKQSEGDTSRFEIVVERLEGFADQFPNAERQVLGVQAMLVDSYAKLGEAEKAADAVRWLQENYPDNRRTAKAALDLYFAYDDQLEALQSAEELDPDAILEATRNAAAAIAAANEANASPTYSQLRTEGRLWLDLDEWEKARVPLEKAVEKYADDAALREKVIKFCVPDLAEAYLELGEITLAKDILAPHVFDEEAEIRLKTKEPTMLMARAMVGSLVGTGSDVELTPGVGGSEEEFAYITDQLESMENRMQDSGLGYTCAWYEAKLQVALAYYIWGESVDGKRESAKKVIDNILVLKRGDRQFVFVDSSCELAETNDALLTRRLGEGTLSSRYRWLDSKLR